MRSVFYLGLILPDLFSRGPVILMEFILKRFPGDIARFFTNFHSPFVVFWTALFISQFFQANKKGVFLMLLAGAGLHSFLDSLQRHVEPVYFWLFPFSWRKWEAGLFWADSSIYIIPFLLIVVITGEYIYFIRGKRSGTK